MTNVGERPEIGIGSGGAKIFNKGIQNLQKQAHKVDEGGSTSTIYT